MIQDDGGGNEEERDQNENPKSPTANATQQETKVSFAYNCFIIQTVQYSFLGQPDENAAQY